jgi:hypothetical protein
MYRYGFIWYFFGKFALICHPDPEQSEGEGSPQPMAEGTLRSAQSDGGAGVALVKVIA